MHLSHTRQQFHEKVSGTEKILEETGDRFEAFAKKKKSLAPIPQQRGVYGSSARKAFAST